MSKPDNKDSIAVALAMSSSTHFRSVHMIKQCLNGNNYSSWSNNVELFFKDESKFSHLISDPPTDAKLLENWEADDAQLLHILFYSMEPQISILFSHVTTCKQAWDYAKLLYSSNMFHVYDTAVELFQSRQEGSLIEYFWKVNRVFEEFNSLLPITSDVKEMQSQREHLAVITFLAGLKPEFEHRSSVVKVFRPWLKYTLDSLVLWWKSPSDSNFERSALETQYGSQARRGGHGSNRINILVIVFNPKGVSLKRDFHKFPFFEILCVVFFSIFEKLIQLLIPDSELVHNISL